MDLSLSGYDSRQRPWYRVAMAAFRDQSLPEAQAAASSLVAWTDVYPPLYREGPQYFPRPSPRATRRAKS